MVNKVRKKRSSSSVKSSQDIIPMAKGYHTSNVTSREYDECSSGKLAGLYRSYHHNDYSVEATSIKDRFEHFEQILKTDEIARKILKLPILDSISNWRDSNYPWENELDAATTVQGASIFARSYGASVVYPIIKNSQGGIVPSTRTLQSLIDSGEQYTIDKLIYTTDNLVFTGEIEKDFYKPWYGYPNKLKIGSKDVHPSRVAFFGNINKPFLLSIKDDLANYHESKRRLEIAVRQNTAVVLRSDWNKISEWIKAGEEVGAKKPTMEQVTTERSRAFHDNLNADNVATINQSEDVIFFQQTNIQSLIDNVKLHMQVLTASSDIILSKLFGVLQSTGLGSSSDTEFLNYAQSLESLRADFIEPSVNQLDNIVNSITGTQSVDWSWNPTRAEELRGEQPQAATQEPTEGSE